jgi:peptidoglycan/xylan/chitin deacetylase (PgdA/CDA1 family)
MGMREKKLLLITFDYELFLGERSGTVQKCLIGPTDKLLACLDKYALKAYFFIDTVYMRRLKEMSKDHSLAKADLEVITNQLVKMADKGHEIHPHIHPHWMDAIYDPKANEWCLSEKKHYTFASLSEEQRRDLFNHAITFIRSVVELSKRTQPVDSYRAGGWSIQPFENFKPHFQKHGIKNEFSVIPGRYFYSDAHQFDFRYAPADMQVYQFSQDICVKDDKGFFTEWTISSLPMTKTQQWFDFKISGLLRRLRITGKFGGSTVNTLIKEEGDLYSRNNVTRQIASFEGLNPYRVMRYLKEIRKLNYFHFISHPKLINGFELKMMGILFRSLNKSPRLETDFRKSAI